MQLDACEVLDEEVGETHRHPAEFAAERERRDSRSLQLFGSGLQIGKALRLGDARFLQHLLAIEETHRHQTIGNAVELVIIFGELDGRRNQGLVELQFLDARRQIQREASFVVGGCQRSAPVEPEVRHFSGRGADPQCLLHFVGAELGQFDRDVRILLVERLDHRVETVGGERKQFDRDISGRDFLRNGRAGKSGGGQQQRNRQIISCQFRHKSSLLLVSGLKSGRHTALAFFMSITVSVAALS